MTMKTTLSIAIAISLVLPLSAAFENWTNKEGKTAQLELQEVTGEDDAKAGVFKMRNGRKVTIKAADLAEEDAKRLAEWKPAAAEPEVVAGKPSVFDEVLDGNLVILDGKKLKKHDPTAKPTEFYVFYYTASWCPPCQAFTPSLVNFYNKHKNDKFELVLITSDGDAADMEGYAADKKMPWPQLKHSKAKSFKGKFDHGVRGIPAVIVCDLEGKIVSRDGRNLAELEKIVK
jgi:thiol-disulfide isomerase/thioredoxin